VLKDEVYLVNLSPFYPGLELAECLVVVEFLAEKQAGIHAVLEDHFVNVVENFGVVYLLDELVQRRHLLCVQ